MKRYLLLASVAGCLLNAGNALAGGGIDEDTHSANLNITATFTMAVSGEVYDLSLGDFVLSPNLSPDDTLATFGEEITTTDKVISNENFSWGGAEVSSGISRITGVTISPTTVELKDAENNVIAKVTDLTLDGNLGSVQYLNGTLEAGSDVGEAGDATAVSGATTITFEF